MKLENLNKITNIVNTYPNNNKSDICNYLYDNEKCIYKLLDIDKHDIEKIPEAYRNKCIDIISYKLYEEFPDSEFFESGCFKAMVVLGYNLNLSAEDTAELVGFHYSEYGEDNIEEGTSIGCSFCPAFYFRNHRKNFLNFLHFIHKDILEIE